MEHAIITNERKENRTSKFINNLFVAYQGLYYKLSPKDILWINSNENYATIHTTDKKFINRISLASLVKKLPENTFLKVHKSFIVRLDAIDHINKTKSKLWIGEQCIPIGRIYKVDLLEALHLIGKA